MGRCFKALALFFCFVIVACSSKTDGAQLLLDNARQLYNEGKYDQAKSEIDSIKTLYPKAFDQIRASLALLDSVRRGQDTHTIAICDSLIALHEPKLDSLKKLFVYQRNKEYQEKGFYVPKESATSGPLTFTTLRSGVGEDGQMYLESVFIGNGQKHNKIKVSAKDGLSAESRPVNDDGLNYRFSNLGKQFEIIRFAGEDDNGVAKFIFENTDKPLTLILEGKNKSSYTLSQPVKYAVKKSYRLSMMMQQLDSLKTEKEKSEYKIYYLDKKNANTNEN
ncbi:hypothetical protein [Dysgonomonas sp. ZJ279]|uniref:hypothetical protein n=1 Tax=Dysgonomonas sp. ZJ279 TaxID=2709796 RepID=UPI0013EB7D4E|nr:hypothetical protein [Dysgonomonas sp. ZJ279]